MSTNLLKFTQALCACLLLFMSATADPYKIGDAVADFSLKNVDGKMVSLADFKQAKGFIVVFTCNHCPFAKRYQDRLKSLNETYAPKGFPVIAISANDPMDVPEDSYENMIVRAKEQNYTFPYLYDERQTVARAFGAKKTPHAFVLSCRDGKYFLEYTGAIDDNGGEPDKVQHPYIINTVDALLQGKPVTVRETKSVGCSIKLK
jgi:peroxiredoxin